MTEPTAGTTPILLAFSGGLDTSFCVPWLAETYGRPVVTLTVDTGSIDAATARMLEGRGRAPPRGRAARLFRAGHQVPDHG